MTKYLKKYKKLNYKSNNLFFFYLKHKEALKNLLEECKTIDPTLPSWHTLMEDVRYVDIYGFKNEKKSEIDSLHYVCNLLKTFYSNQPNSIEDSIWDIHIKKWKHSFSVTV